MSNIDKRGESTSTNRRKLLKMTGSGIGLSALTGCVSSISGGGGGEEELFVGGIYPLSGSYGGPGQKMQEGVQTAVDLARENNDAGDISIKFEDADTQADPATGRQKAQELINNGADILVGIYSAAVEKSVVELANQNEVLTATFGVDPSLFQDSCSLYHFSPASPIWKQDHAVLGYALREGLGNSVYTISANYSWGQTHRKYVKNNVVPKYDAEFLGNTFTELGQSDFSRALTEARESGADIIYSPTAGGDMVNLANQAGSFGMFEDHVFMWPVGGLTNAQQINASVLSNDNFYTGLGWYWNFDNPATKEYVQSYGGGSGDDSGGTPSIDDVPSWPSAILYSGMRTLMKSFAEVGEVDTTAVAQETAGNDITPQLWDAGEHFRECNNSNIFPYYVARGKENPEGADVYEIVAEIDDYDEIYRSCSETGCTIDR